MKIEVEAKFGVGDLVTVKGAKERLRITQVVTITCSVGTQVSYEGRVHGISADYLNKEKKYTASASYNQFYECEMGEKVEE